MGFFKRAKLLWNKVKDRARNVIRKIITISPKVFNALMKLVEIGDSLGVRKIIINAIPEAGGYINQILDALLQAKELKCVDKIADALKDLMDKKIDPVKFIQIAKDIIQSAIAALRGRVTKAPITEEKPKELELEYGSIPGQGETEEGEEKENEENQEVGGKTIYKTLGKLPPSRFPKIRPRPRPTIAPTAEQKAEELPPVDNFSSLQEEEEEPPKKGTSSIFGAPVNVIQ